MKEISPPQAYRLLKENAAAMLVDVRSTMEYDYVGHPVDALHVPIKEPPDWDTHADFVARLTQSITAQTGDEENPHAVPLLMLCRSGKRSELAAQLALDAGFTEVYNVIEGFEGDRDEQGHRSSINGWRFHQLPWEQS